jgi:hypothetical protein
LRAGHLVKLQVQGKHRYYSLAGPEVATVLESLAVLAGGTQREFVPNTPNCLRAARTCYDHLAGTLGVSLHDRCKTLGWIEVGDPDYDVTPKGVKALQAVGLDIEGARALRRRFAFGCLDWSERRPHLGGALGAAILDLALSRKWLTRELEGRALSVTSIGRREMSRHFGLESAYRQCPPTYSE